MLFGNFTHRSIKADIKESPEQDDIYSRVLKELKCKITELLTIICNLLQMASIPEDWQVANIYLQHLSSKMGFRGILWNYRPVNLASILGKLVESMIKNKISSHEPICYAGRVTVVFVKGKPASPISWSSLRVLTNLWTWGIQLPWHIWIFIKLLKRSHTKSSFKMDTKLFWIFKSQADGAAEKSPQANWVGKEVANELQCRHVHGNAHGGKMMSVITYKHNAGLRTNFCDSGLRPWSHR